MDLRALFDILSKDFKWLWVGLYQLKQSKTTLDEFKGLSIICMVNEMYGCSKPHN